jgi:hypothetical protein
MFKLLILFAHLLATCVALGVIIATDLRLLAKITSSNLRIAPPNKYVERLVAGALIVLYITGGVLIWLGLEERSDYLLNPKLEAKILLVLTLTANAFVLHTTTFRRLTKPRPVSQWKMADRMSVAVPVALSNSLWLYCAFLGIARPWNFEMPLLTVLGIGVLVFVITLCAVMAMFALASRQRRQIAQGEYEQTQLLISRLPKEAVRAVKRRRVAIQPAANTTHELNWANLPEPVAMGR